MLSQPPAPRPRGSSVVRMVRQCANREGVVGIDGPERRPEGAVCARRMARCVATFRRGRQHPPAPLSMWFKVWRAAVVRVSTSKAGWEGEPAGVTAERWW